MKIEQIVKNIEKRKERKRRMKIFFNFLNVVGILIFVYAVCLIFFNIGA